MANWFKTSARFCISDHLAKALDDLGFCWSRTRRVAPAVAKEQQQVVQDEIDTRLDEASPSETFFSNLRLLSYRLRPDFVSTNMPGSTWRFFV